MSLLDLALKYKQANDIQRKMVIDQHGGIVNLTPEEISLVAEGAIAQAQDGMDWLVGTWYNVGQTLKYNGKIYKVIQSHMAQATWIPDAVPALYQEEKPIGSPWKQPVGSQDSYKSGDIVIYNGNTYKSLIDNNVWSPDAYPQGWQKI